MIFYLVTAEHKYTIRTYLDTWGKALADRIRVMTYQELPQLQRLPLGTYIFSDLERLSPPERELGSQVWAQLSRVRASLRLLNHPRQRLPRYELLRQLYETGRNRYWVGLATESERPPRFPVFVRDRSQHTGALSDLLPGQKELDQALVRLLVWGYPLQNLLIVEFCDCGDANGVFRKYSAFMVGGCIVPRHLIFSRHWMLKKPDLLDEDKLREEREYLDENPHREWLREVFALARVEYGRIDYGLWQGKPQVWEINTNPMVMLLPQEYHPSHLDAQELFASRIQSAFEAINSPLESSATVALSLSPELLRGIGVQKDKQRQGPPAGAFLQKLRTHPLVRLGVRLPKAIVLKNSSWVLRILRWRLRKTTRSPRATATRVG